MLADARAWLLDIGCPASLLEGRSDSEVRREIDRQWDGGWDDFVGTACLEGLGLTGARDAWAEPETVTAELGGEL